MPRTIPHRVVKDNKAETYFNHSSFYLAEANEAREHGKTKLAEKLDQKGQYWLDLANKAAGNA